MRRAKQGQWQVNHSCPTTWEAKAGSQVVSYTDQTRWVWWLLTGCRGRKMTGPLFKLCEYHSIPFYPWSQDWLKNAKNYEKLKFSIPKISSFLIRSKSELIKTLGPFTGSSISSLTALCIQNVLPCGSPNPKFLGCNLLRKSAHKVGSTLAHQQQWEWNLSNRLGFQRNRWTTSSFLLVAF